MAKRNKYKSKGGFNEPMFAVRTPEQHRAIIQPVETVEVAQKPLVSVVKTPKPKARRAKLSNFGDGTSSLRARMSELGFSCYVEYLASPHWLGVRKRWRESRLFRGWRCETVGCGNREGLSLHHWTYVRVGREELSDLVLVCAGCHRKIHQLERRGASLPEATWAVTKTRAFQIAPQLSEAAKPLLNFSKGSQHE